MFKPSPWEWHPSLLDDELQNIAQSTICLIPFWQPSQDSSNVYAYDVASRKLWTGAGVYESGAQGLYYRSTTVLQGIDSGFDYLGGKSEVTVTAAFDFNSPSIDDSSLLSTNWNTESVCLWRNENRTTGQIRLLLDVASTTIDITSATTVGASGFNVASFRYDGATLNQFFNGIKDSNSGSGTGAIDASAQGYRIGRGGTSDGGFLGQYYLLHIADRALGDEEIAVLHSRIFDLVAPREDAPMFAFGPTGGAPSADEFGSLLGRRGLTGGRIAA